MNILQIFASKTWGGGEKYVLDLSKKLIELNHNVYFVSPKSEVIKNKTDKIATLDFIPLRGVFDVFSAIKLSKLIKKNNIDIVHCHNFKCAIVVMYALFLCRKNKTKFIMTRHLIKKSKNNFLYNLLYRQLNKIIFVSKLAMDIFISNCPKINHSKLIVIHNSILPIEKNCSSEPVSIPHNNGKVLLSYIGRLDKMKGVDVLLTALPKLKNTNYHLFIAGVGEDKDRLVSIVSDFNLNEKVTFLGFVEDVSTLMESIDIGIVPSIGQESFGLVLLEYMRAGKTIISTNNGAQTEFLDNNCAVLISPNNTEMLAEKIGELIENKEKRQELGWNAKERFDKDFNYNIFLNKILDVYNGNYTKPINN